MASYQSVISYLTVARVTEGAKKAPNVGRRPTAGDYKGAQPPYLADKRPEGALSASNSLNTLS